MPEDLRIAAWWSAHIAIKATLCLTGLHGDA